MSRVPVDYSDVSPYMILREISALAENRIPSCLEGYCRKTGLAAWELLEEAVFYFFRQVLMLETLRFGARTLFEHEPEGLAFSTRTQPPFALMYECKSRVDPYRMTSDDVLRYCDYIRRKRHETRIRHHLELTRFLIVAPSFAGGLDERLRTIENEGIVVSLVPAALLGRACSCVREMEYSDIQLLEVDRCFARGLLTDEHVADFFRIAAGSSKTADAGAAG